MTLPIEILIHLPGPPSPTLTYDVPAGSLWFASQLLDAPARPGYGPGSGCPAGPFASAARVTRTANEVVVPSGVTFDLNVNTESQPPDPGLECPTACSAEESGRTDNVRTVQNSGLLPSSVGLHE